jgi:hypothetical protein
VIMPLSRVAILTPLTSGRRNWTPASARKSLWCLAPRAGLILLGFALSVTNGTAQPRNDCVPLAPGATPAQTSSPRPASASEIPVWKTITLGEYKDAIAVRAALYVAPCPIGLGAWADEILGRPDFPFTKTRAELDLVLISVADLGFANDGVSLRDINARALAMGLELCPADVGPVLRPTYLNQPRGEFLHVAMKPVTLFSGELVDFTLGNDGARLLLIGGDGRSEVILPGAVRFVFVRPPPTRS